LSPLAISSIVFAIVFGGSLAGALLRKALPQHHLEGDAKDIIRLGSGLLATIAGLVLGLLISSANSTRQTLDGQLKRVTADVILLDQLLQQYGPDARRVRELLRPTVGSMVNRIWRKDSSKPATRTPFQATATADAVVAQIVTLSPSNEAQRALKERAVRVGNDLAQQRLLLFVAGTSLPTPFLAVLTCWLAIIFASFTLFSRLNPTGVAALFVFAWSAAGAIFLILELSEPFAGLMQLSSEPLRNALLPL
jgi:hypothetical protein